MPAFELESMAPKPQKEQQQYTRYSLRIITAHKKIRACAKKWAESAVGNPATRAKLSNEQPEVDEMLDRIPDYCGCWSEDLSNTCRQSGGSLPANRYFAPHGLFTKHIAFTAKNCACGRQMPGSYPAHIMVTVQVLRCDDCINFPF